MSYVFGLGDSMRVGPQYVVPTNTAAQIIQRGPHGKWISPPLSVGPSKDRQEFRWWNSYTHTTLPWVPPQTVVGVAGLSGITEASFWEKRSLSSAAKEIKQLAIQCSRTGLGNQSCSIVLQTAKTFRARLRTFEHWGEGLFGIYDAWNVIDMTAQQAEVIASKKIQGQDIPKGALEDPEKQSQSAISAQQAGQLATGQVPTLTKEFYGEDVPSWVKGVSEDISKSLSSAAEEAKKNQLKLIAMAVLGLGAVAFLYGAGTGAGRGVGERISNL